MTLLDSSSMFSSFSIHTFQLNSNNNENSAYSPTLANSSSSSRACLACRMAHKSCDRAKPACSRCVSRGISHLCCEPSTKKRGRPRKWKDSAEQSTPTQEQQSYEEEINSFSPQLVSNEVSNNERVVSPSNNSNSTTGTAFDMLNNAAQVNSPIMYNAIPSNTCKSPVEEALLTETLKKTQSKKLKFIKIMNYNPNHRETFSPKFTITSQSQEKKHSISSPIPMENQPLQKKRKSKSTNPIVSSTNYQTSTVSQPISHQVNQFSIPAFPTSFVTSPTISQREVYTSNPISPPALYSYQTNPFQKQENETFQNNSPIYYPNSSATAISTNQPRHCDEGRFVNNQVKLPSIYSLLSLQQE